MLSTFFRIPRRGFVAASLAAGASAAGRRAWSGGPAPRREVPWLAEVQSHPQLVHKAGPDLRPLLIDEQGRPITTRAAWQRKCAEIRRFWLDFLGIDKLARPAVPALTVLDEQRSEGIIRQQVRYQAEPGLSAEAYLLKPARIESRLPGVVVLHSTDPATIRQSAGLIARPGREFGPELACRGCVTFCPRCFLWPNDLEPAAQKSLDYAGRTKLFQARHPGCKGMAKMLFDAQVATDILAALPEVDPQRLGAVGHSLGAKEVLYLAAFDERIRAAVSSEGGIGTACRIGMPPGTWATPSTAPVSAASSTSCWPWRRRGRFCCWGAAPPTATAVGLLSRPPYRSIACTAARPTWDSSSTRKGTPSRPKPNSGWRSGSPPISKPPASGGRLLPLRPCGRPSPVPKSLLRSSGLFCGHR